VVDVLASLSRTEDDFLLWNFVDLTAYKIDTSTVGGNTRNAAYLFEMIGRGERI
jgi:hypothetical protein